MKKFKKILAGSLTALSFAGNFKTSGKNNSQNAIGENNSQSQSEIVVNNDSNNLSRHENIQDSKGNLKNSGSINKIINFIKEHKKPIIGFGAGATGTFMAIQVLKEIARNGLFEASIENWLSRYNYGGRYIYVDPKNKFWKEIKAYDLENRYKDFYLQNEKSSGLNTLHGYIYDDVAYNNNKFEDNQKINKIIIVFGGTSSLGFKTLDRLIFPDDHGTNYSKNSSKAVKNSVVICVDYPSYDESKGKRPKNEKTLQKYAERVLKYATDELQKKYPNAKDNIEVYGYSLGGYSSSWISKFPCVKKLNIWSPVQINSAVSYFGLPRWFGEVISWLAFGNSGFDSIENLKNSNPNCVISLFSGTDAEGDFLSIEHSVLEDKKYDWQIKAKEWEKMKTDVYGSKDWKKLWETPSAKTDEEKQKLKKENKIKYEKLFDDVISKNSDKIKYWQVCLSKAAWRKLVSEVPDLAERLTVGCYVASHSSKHVFNIEKSKENNLFWNQSRDKEDKKDKQIKN